MRKFLILAIIAMFAVAMIGLGTFAYFSDRRDISSSRWRTSAPIQRFSGSISG